MRGPALFTQVSVCRALRAVKQSGVDARVEIGRNGAISIIPNNSPSGKPAAEAANSVKDWDKALGKRA